MKNPRQISLEILMAVLYEGAYSNIAINQAFARNELENIDRGFITELVYGSLSKKLYLEHIIQKYSKISLEKLSKEVRAILILGLYQIRFMDSVTNFAAVDESVKLCKKVQPKASGYVNGLLRTVLREADAFEVKVKKKKKFLATKYSVSIDLVDLFIGQYGQEETERILEALAQKPDTYIRTNRLKTNRQELMEKLRSMNLESEEVKEEELAIKVLNLKRIGENPYFKEGLFTVQDLSSMKAVRVLDPQEGERILDLCAAPGGKTTFIAELMGNRGQLLARDISENKLGLIEATAQRLGLEIIRVETKDARLLDRDSIGKFDRVLVDAPCSGLGIIRKKPELRYKTMAEIEPLYEIQAQILENAASYLKKGGVLVYSTCTINQRENSDQVKSFLEKESGQDYQLLSEESLLFEEGTSDGFYIAKMIKKEN